MSIGAYCVLTHVFCCSDCPLDSLCVDVGVLPRHHRCVASPFLLRVDPVFLYKKYAADAHAETGYVIYQIIALANLNKNVRGYWSEERRARARFRASWHSVSAVVFVVA